MPVGLLKSPNTDEYCKYNLYDEIHNENNKANHLKSNAINGNLSACNNKSKSKRKRLLTPRTLGNMKNNPELKFKIINDFIQKIT